MMAFTQERVESYRAAERLCPGQPCPQRHIFRVGDLGNGPRGNIAIGLPIVMLAGVHNRQIGQPGALPLQPCPACRLILEPGQHIRIGR